MMVSLAGFIPARVIISPDKYCESCLVHPLKICLYTLLKYLNEHLIIFEGDNANPCRIDKPYISLDNKLETLFLSLSLQRESKYWIKKVFNKTIAAQVHGSSLVIRFLIFLKMTIFFWNSVESKNSKSSMEISGKGLLHFDQETSSLIGNQTYHRTNMFSPYQHNSKTCYESEYECICIMINGKTCSVPLNILSSVFG